MVPRFAGGKERWGKNQNSHDFLILHDLREQRAHWCRRLWLWEGQR